MKSHGKIALQRFARCCGASTVCLLMWSGFALLATGQDTAWFSGGGYDGYDFVDGAAAPGYPQAHNAAGATNVTDASAWLNGMLTYTGSVSAVVRVYWGETDGGTNRGLWTDSYEFGVVEEFDLLTRQIAVSAGSLYYYRLYATNAAGEEGWAPCSSVVHSFAAPEVSTNQGAGVSITLAVLNGALTAGVEADMWLDWGQTAQGVVPVSTNTVDLGTRTQEGTTAVPNPFKVMLSSLSPATTHAYRIRATNSYGAAASPWAWFTTRPSDYVKVSDPAWSAGGGYDGYDCLELADGPMPGWRKGTMFKMH